MQDATTIESRTVLATGKPMTPDDKEIFARSFPVHVGVDTGKTFHKLVARGPDGRRQKAVRVEVNRAGFDATHTYLMESFPGVTPDRVLVGLEFAGHNGFTFAHFLAAMGYHVVSVLPFVTRRLRDIEDNSPRKDDAKDASQVCSLVGQGRFVTFPLLDETGTELRLLATERRRLGVESTRIRNRLHSALDLAWPEFAAHFAGLDYDTPLALLARWSTPSDLRSASPVAVHALVRKVSRNHVRPVKVRSLLQAARETIALERGTAARRSEIQRMLERWSVVRRQIAEVEARLAELVEVTHAARALLTVPGVSVVCAATLVAELGNPAWYQSPRQVLKLAGMNLAGRESGTSVRGRTRQTKRGRPLLRRQLFLLAGRWCQKRGLYRGYYESLLGRGKPKVSAICAVARKLVPMLLRVMQTGEPFDVELWRGNRMEPSKAA